MAPLAHFVFSRSIRQRLSVFGGNRHETGKTGETRGKNCLLTPSPRSGILRLE
jgi:hypothetical protein